MKTFILIGGILFCVFVLLPFLAYLLSKAVTSGGIMGRAMAFRILKKETKQEESTNGEEKEQVSR